MHSVCLSVCLFVHAFTLVNDLWMSWNLNILLMLWYSRDCIKNGVHRTNVRLQRRTKVSQYITTYGEKFLKPILTNFCLTKYKNINACHSHVEKYASYAGSHKWILIDFGQFNYVSWIAFIILNFIALCCLYRV